MSAAAKAEARRKAILSRGTDRLAKLTTSARGEDAVVYDDRPVPGTRASAVDSFVGDAGDMPLPISRKPSATRPHTARKASSASASDTSTAADPTIWTHEQQEQFMRALMGSGLAGPPSSASTLVGDGGGSDRLTSASQDPLAALMASLIPNTSDSSSLENTVVSSFTQPGSNPIPSPSGVAATPKSRSLVLRLLPLLHLASAFGLLLSFIYSTLSTSADQWTGGSRWAHWADLRWGKSDMLASQRTPFFTAFLTLEILLQSLRITSGLDQVRLPMMLQLALPSLPPPVPSLVLNGFKYSQIIGVLFDDLAGVVVGIGFVVWVASLITA